MFDQEEKEGGHGRGGEGRGRKGELLARQQLTLVLNL